MRRSTTGRGASASICSRAPVPITRSGWTGSRWKAASRESEPIYGETYLPRKFKIAVAVPPHNDVDVYTNDLGFVAIAEGDRLLGFNVSAGGGMGTTHGDTSTYPRLADPLGFVTPEQVLAVAEAVVTTQRDFGDRVSRRHARLKYTIDRMGLDAFRAEVERRAGLTFAIRPSRDLHGRGRPLRLGARDRRALAPHPLSGERPGRRPPGCRR